MRPLPQGSPGTQSPRKNLAGVEGEELLAQAGELGIEFPLLASDPGPELGYPLPTVLPTTLILDPQGNVVTRLIGPQTEAALQLELQLAREQKDRPKDT